MLNINHASYYELVNQASGDFSFLGDESFGGWIGQLTFSFSDDAYCHAWMMFGTVKCSVYTGRQ